VYKNQWGRKRWVICTLNPLHNRCYLIAKSGKQFFGHVYNVSTNKERQNIVLVVSLTQQLPAAIFASVMMIHFLLLCLVQQCALCCCNHFYWYKLTPKARWGKYIKASHKASAGTLGKILHSSYTIFPWSGSHASSTAPYLFRSGRRTGSDFSTDTHAQDRNLHTHIS